MLLYFLNTDWNILGNSGEPFEISWRAAGWTALYNSSLRNVKLRQYQMVRDQLDRSILRCDLIAHNL